jgi:hypothetical protein
MAELSVQFSKRADGIVTLRCVRKDGSVTWQRHDKQGVFYSFHDLSHLAVETTLGFRQGFFGLIADGWDIMDTSGKGARGGLPQEAILVEHVVGLLERERSGGAPPLSAAEFNAQIEEMFSGDEGSPRVFTDAELNAARNRMAEIHREWAAVDSGKTFDLTFER